MIGFARLHWKAVAQGAKKKRCSAARERGIDAWQWLWVRADRRPWRLVKRPGFPFRDHQIVLCLRDLNTRRGRKQREDLFATGYHAIAYFDPGGEWEPEGDSKWEAGSKELQAFAVGVRRIRRVCSPACTSLIRPDLGVDDRQVSVRKRLGPMKIG